jgi:methyltransferase (TIGR00027 family)
MTGTAPNDGPEASITAVTAAVFRAAHLALDDDPKVFDDPFALPFSGAGGQVSLYDHANTVLTKFTSRLGPKAGPAVFRYLRALMIMRSRYAEDELKSAMVRGLRRYVILGAGLDSFAYRHPDLAGSVQVFDIDHLATQRWKQQRLLELGIRQPSNLTFLPIDLNEQTLLNGFRAAGYSLQEPAFLSWLGVTQYLPEEVVFHILQQVAAMPPGTEIVFTYIVREDMLDGEDRQLFAIFAQSAATRGEPWITLFESAGLTRALEGLGFAQIRDLSPEAANARYFDGRRDGLRVPGLEHVMHAQVGSSHLKRHS